MFWLERPNRKHSRAPLRSNLFAAFPFRVFPLDCRVLECALKPLKIIDETPAWIVIDKPAPLQIHPSKPDGTFTLWHALKDLLAFEVVNGGQVSIINRLDRET